MLLTANEYKILQQTALEASYFILNSFATISCKQLDTNSAHHSNENENPGVLDTIKESRAAKKIHLKYLEVFNSDPKKALLKIVEEGFIEKGEE